MSPKIPLVDALFMIAKATRIFFLLLLDYLNPFVDHQFTLDKLHDPRILSKYLKKDVIRVELKKEKTSGDQKKQNESQSTLGRQQAPVGDIGTTSERRFIIAHLANGQIINLMAKTSSSKLAEKIFLIIEGIYENELIFYEYIAPLLRRSFHTVSNLVDNTANESDDKDSSKWTLCPRCYCCQRIGYTNFLLLLEDTSSRIQYGGSRYYPIGSVIHNKDELKKIIQMYAQLHAYFWQLEVNEKDNKEKDGVEDVVDLRRWMWHYSPITGHALGSRTPVYNGTLAAVARDIIVNKRAKSLTPGMNESENVKNKLTLYRDCLMAADLFTTKIDRVRAYWASSSIQTFVHGDSHYANIFFSQNTSDDIPTRIGLIDFQLMVLDQGMRDITYLLMMSCKSQWLANVEEELIRYYLTELEIALLKRFPNVNKSALCIPSYEQAYFLYRSYSLWLLHCWFIVCAMVDGFAEEFIMECTQNILDICHRLDCLGAIEEILSMTISIDKKGQ